MFDLWLVKSMDIGSGHEGPVAVVSRGKGSADVMRSRILRYLHAITRVLRRNTETEQCQRNNDVLTRA
jgi:hypothetical protein